MPSNKRCTLIVTLVIIVFVVSEVPTCSPDIDESNANNGNSINGTKYCQTTGKVTGTGTAGTGSCYCYCPSQTTANAESTGTCFASGSLITLANRKRIPIEQLRSGDELLTTDGSTIFTTQMMMMLDKNTLSQAMFHTITTSTGHNVSLTGLHLIGIIQNDKTIKYIPAKEVKIGDVLYVMSDGQLMASPVTNVIVEIKTGYYAPLTRSGTLLVNDIMASCYANVQSHEAAQFYMGPLRLYHWLAQSLFINKPFGYQEMDGAKHVGAGHVLIDPLAALTGARHLFVNYFINQTYYGIIEGGYLGTNYGYGGLSTAHVKLYRWDHGGLQWKVPTDRCEEFIHCLQINTIRYHLSSLPYHFFFGPNSNSFMWWIFDQCSTKIRPLLTKYPFVGIDYFWTREFPTKKLVDKH